jgi:hypothetical protein
MLGRTEADLIAAARRRRGDDATVDYLVRPPADCDD